MLTCTVQSFQQTTFNKTKILKNSQCLITLNFVDICKRFVSGGGRQPGVVPGDVWTVVHDALQGEGERHFVGRHSGGGVQVGQHGVVVHHDHNLCRNKYLYS